MYRIVKWGNYTSFLLLSFLCLNSEYSLQISMSGAPKVAYLCDRGTSMARDKIGEARQNRLGYLILCYNYILDTIISF